MLGFKRINYFLLILISTVITIFFVYSVILFIFIHCIEYLNIDLKNYTFFSSLFDKLKYDFYVWKIHFDTALFINLGLVYLFIYLLIKRRRYWKFDVSFYMIIPIFCVSLYIALWPGFFDINFFNFISLDYLEKNIKIYHKMLLIYEMKGFNLIHFIYDETHFISKIVVFNTYLFYFLYISITLFFIFDVNLNSFYKIILIILLALFINWVNYIFIELFYHFAIIPYKIIIDESIKFNLFNAMNYINTFFFTIF